MSACILDGKALAARIEVALQEEVRLFSNTLMRSPRLAVILVGAVAASHSYVKAKSSAAKRVGIDSRVIELPTEVTTAELIRLIESLGDSTQQIPFDGILVQLPLPAHVDTRAVLDAVPPKKDVDGFHPENAGLLFQGRPQLVPCTALGVQKMILDAGIPTAGRRTVVIGRSDIVGKPLAMLLASRGLGGDSTVTLLHSRSPNLAAVTLQADILIAAVGVPGLVTADMVQPGAAVIDVGINRVDSQLVGDVDFISVREVAGWISPVPGGVGPMTVAMLMSNTLQAARLQSGI